MSGNMETSGHSSAEGGEGHSEVQETTVNIESVSETGEMDESFEDCELKEGTIGKQSEIQEMEEEDFSDCAKNEEIAGETEKKVPDETKETEEILKETEEISKETEELPEERLENALLEQKKMSEEMDKKFEDVLSKEIGSDEYKEALKEYNDLKAQKEELDEKIQSMESKKDLVEEKTSYENLAEYMNAHNYGREDYETYSQDPEWRRLHKQEFPDYELPPLKESDNTQEWKRMSVEMSPQENLEATNPNFESGMEWQTNCQRCVPTYEMRERGYDVTALPCTDADDYLSYHPFEVWEDVDIQATIGDGKADIEEAMNEWGDGSRAQVVVLWEVGDGGHTFIAEQRDGKTYFSDPQTGETDVSWYFDNVKDNCTRYCRIDDAKTSKKITECCKGV